MEEAQHQTVNQAANTSLSSQSSLYVGDLNVSITEHELYELFSRVGHVVSVRVNRNQATNSAYAYVNYTCPEFAQEAHSSLNYTMLHGKQMRIMYVDPDPTQRKSGAANIYVKNLDPLVDNKILHDTFSAYGQILSCRVATNDAGESKGHGYVQFEQEEAASKAIQEANGLLLLEKEIFVGPFMKREERELAASPSKFNNVYVKSFSDATTDADLYRIFGDFGSITSAVVMRDTNGNSKGFGFVNFENADDAVRAVENLNGKFIDGKEWYVGRAQKKSERQLELRERFELNHRDRTEKQKNVNVYVKNLDANVDERVLKDFFSSIGHVVSTKIIRLPDGQSKGIGFVQYSSPDDARKAISEMNGVKLGSKPLFVARAQRKEDRQVKDGIVNGPRINPHHMFHPGAMFGQQYFYGQPLPSIMPHQANGFGYQQPMMPAIGPGGVPVPNYFMPSPPLRAGFQGPRFGKRGMGAGPHPNFVHQQVAPGNSNQSSRYSQIPRYTSEVASSRASEASASMGGPSDNVRTPSTATNVEQQRMILGEQLYPLVDKLEHERAGKVTGMLLELGEAEVVRLINSPEALKARVNEALDVLRLAKSGSVPPSAELSSLSIDESSKR